MQHAARSHIKKNLDEDPVFYQGLSDRLEEILQAFMAEGIVDALDRRGVLDELPDHMIAARPRRENEIRVVEYALSGERTAAGLLRTHALEELEAPSQPFFGSDVFTSLVTLPGGRMLLLWPLRAVVASAPLLPNVSQAPCVSSPPRGSCAGDSAALRSDAGAKQARAPRGHPR